MNSLAEKRENYAKKLDEAKERLIRLLSQIAGVERVILFGSYSRGKKDLLTDLDVLVILRTDLGFMERLKLLYQSLALPVDLDLICLTPEEFEAVKEKPFSRGSLRRGSFFMRKSALEEGRRWVEQAKEDLKWAKELARLGGYHLFPDSIPARIYTENIAKERGCSVCGRGS